MLPSKIAIIKTYSHLLLKFQLKKSKSCQAVANMCVMLLYKDEQNGGPCRIFREYRYIPTSTSNNNHLPWLYYGEGDASILLNRKKIETHYSLYTDHKVGNFNYCISAYDIPLGQIFFHRIVCCASTPLITPSMEHS